MELSQVFGGDALKAADLQGREPTLIIESVTKKDFKDGNKLVITFEGRKKALVCNKTNANRIAQAHGTNTDDWVGKEITLYVDWVDFQGKSVEAIRVKPPRRAAPSPAQRQPAQSSAPPSDLDDEIPF